jgi:hypothetical protein
MQAYICDEGLARFCTEEYKTPTNKNFNNAFMHLTNYSINKMSDSYVHPQGGEGIMYDNDGTKRTLSALYDALKKQGIDVQTIKDNIKQTCSRTMQIFAPMVEH